MRKTIARKILAVAYGLMILPIELVFTEVYLSNTYVPLYWSLIGPCMIVGTMLALTTYAFMDEKETLATPGAPA